MKKYTYSQKIVFLMKSKSLLHHAKSLFDAYSALHKCFSDQFGDANGDHWPEWAKNELVQSVHDLQVTLDESLKLWLACGRRVHTWRKLSEAIGKQ